MSFQNRSSLRIVQSVLFALILREMRTRISGRRFGAFWTLFEPITQVLIFVVMFSLRSASASNVEYPAYLVSGMIPFFMMRNIITKGMAAVNANRALFAYKQIKPLDTIIARSIVEIAIYACVYMLFMAVMYIWFDLDLFMVGPLRWLSVIGIGVLLSFSIGLLFCMLVDIIPEFSNVAGILFMVLYFLSGIIFPIWALPNEIISVLLWNPFVHIIDELRLATFSYYPDHVGVNIFYPIKLTVFLLCLSLGLYRVRRRKLVAI